MNDVYVFILWRTADWYLYLIHSAFPCFSSGRQNPALIAILKTSAGSMSFIEFLATMLPSGQTKKNAVGDDTEAPKAPRLRRRVLHGGP